MYPSIVSDILSKSLGPIDLQLKQEHYKNRLSLKGQYRHVYFC